MAAGPAAAAAPAVSGVAVAAGCSYCSDSGYICSAATSAATVVPSDEAAAEFAAAVAPQLL